MILGCDAVGVDPDGNEVVVYPVVADPADPRGMSISVRALPGYARRAGRGAAGEPGARSRPGCRFTDAACLPTAWLTAYRMLTTRGRVDEGEAVLVQGAGGGVATAAVVLAVALGKRVYATSRDAGQAGPDRRARGHRARSPAPGCRSGSTWSSRRSARRRSTTR